MLALAVNITERVIKIRRTHKTPLERSLWFRLLDSTRLVSPHFLPFPYFVLPACSAVLFDFLFVFANANAVITFWTFTFQQDMTSDGAVTFWIFLLCLIASPRLEGSEAGRPDELHIGGIFPIAGKGGWQGGQACMPAARLALDDVNKEPNLLPGFKLILHSNDSEVSSPHPTHSKLYTQLRRSNPSTTSMISCPRHPPLPHPT